jgi:hypothetical protein
MENEVIGKDFNLGMIDFLFHAFTPCVQDFWFRFICVKKLVRSKATS